MDSFDLFKVKGGDKINYIEINDSYKLYDSAISLIAGVCSINLVIDAYHSEATPYTEGHYLFFEGRKNVTNKIYYIFPYDIYRHLVEDKWPTAIKIHFKEKTFPDQEQDEGSIGSFAKVFLSLGQATFIQFWELIKGEINSKCGSDQKKWSDIFKFGWIIRNALAHNFKITINDSQIENIRWNNLVYGFSKNGTDISDEIMFLELIVLMKDIEDEIRSTSN